MFQISPIDIHTVNLFFLNRAIWKKKSVGSNKDKQTHSPAVYHVAFSFIPPNISFLKV